VTPLDPWESAFIRDPLDPCPSVFIHDRSARIRDSGLTTSTACTVLRQTAAWICSVSCTIPQAFGSLRFDVNYCAAASYRMRAEVAGGLIQGSPERKLKAWAAGKYACKPPNRGACAGVLSARPDQGAGNHHGDESRTRGDALRHCHDARKPAAQPVGTGDAIDSERRLRYARS
jgi:hypothetical protein